MRKTLSIIVCILLCLSFNYSWSNPKTVNISRVPHGKHHISGAATIYKSDGGPDIAAPVIMAPPDVYAKAVGELTPLVTLGKPIVSDDSGTTPTVTNDAPEGFPIGVTIVTWVAIDDVGNYATATQKVTMWNELEEIVTFNTINVPGANNTRITGVDGNGNMVGYFDLIDVPDMHGFYYDTETKIFTIINVPGANMTCPLGINDRYIFGCYWDLSSHVRGFTCKLPNGIIR